MTGVLDLSLPGTAAIASCVCGWLLTNGYPTWLALAGGPGAAASSVGLVNGFITLRGFNPIIVTIGTLSVLTGLAAVVAGGYTFPGLTQLEFMGTHRYLRIGDAGETFPGIPAPVFIVAAVFIIGTIFLTRTRDGLRLMAVGANAEAVRRAGIPSTRYIVLGFVISGLLAALGGLVNTANVTEANPAASPAIIFTALTAVALAGVALTGGRGSLPRVLVGALILATIANGLTIRGIQPYWATVATGALLLGSLLLRADPAERRLRAADVGQPLRPREAGLIMTTTSTSSTGTPALALTDIADALRLRPRARRHRHARRCPARSSPCSATTAPASPPCSR